MQNETVSKLCKIVDQVYHSYKKLRRQLRVVHLVCKSVQPIKPNNAFGHSNTQR